MARTDEKVAEFIKVESPEQKLQTIGQWALRCYESGRTAAVHAATRQEAEQLDDLLWTFTDGAFLPHAIAEEAGEPVLEPVLIYYGDQQPGPAHLLIHASGGEPGESLTRYEHILDFAEVYDEQLRQASRRRFTACRDAGCRMFYRE